MENVVKEYSPVLEPVIMTDNAISHFNNVAAGKYVKFGIIGGGCAGYQYHWEVFETLQDHFDDDWKKEYGNFTLYVDSVSVPYLSGTKVDYVSDITGSKVVIENPNAQGGCGCGDSVNITI